MSILKLSVALLAVIAGTSLYSYRLWIAPRNHAPTSATGSGSNSIPALQAAREEMEIAIRDAELQLLQASNRLAMARVTLESARNRHEVAAARDAADYHRYRLERDLAQQTSGTIVAMGGQPPPVTPYNPSLKLDAAQALREYELAQKTFEAESASLEFARQTCALQVERAKATFVAKTRNAAPRR